jgi:hypothetical protein
MRKNPRDITPIYSSWDQPNRKGSKVQSILFSKEYYTGRMARQWLLDHNFLAPKMDSTQNYMRYRQEDPKLFQKDSFRTLEFKRGILAVVGIPKRIQTKKNPQSKLVPKENVKLKGFTKQKTKAVEKEIPYVLGYLEKLKGKKVLFPSPIRPLTQKEFLHGRSVVDNGHPQGAGHGQYNAEKKEIAINKDMGVFDLVTNVCHENLHHIYPNWSEERVRDTTGYIMQELYGVFNLGRPFAEEKDMEKPIIYSKKKTQR